MIALDASGAGMAGGNLVGGGVEIRYPGFGKAREEKGDILVINKVHHPLGRKRTRHATVRRKRSRASRVINGNRWSHFIGDNNHENSYPDRRQRTIRRCNCRACWRFRGPNTQSDAETAVFANRR